MRAKGNLLKRFNLIWVVRSPSPSIFEGQRSCIARARHAARMRRRVRNRLFENKIELSPSSRTGEARSGDP